MRSMTLRGATRVVARTRMGGWLRGSRARSNFAKVASANALSQGLLVAATPLLARLYGPEAFAVLGLFAATSQVLVAVCTARLHMLMPGARLRGEAAQMGWLGLAALGGTCVLTFGWLGLGAPGTTLFGEHVEAVALLWWLPVHVGALGLQQLARGWWMRDGTLGPVGRARLGQTWCYLVLALVLGAAGLAGGGLVGATAVAALVGAAMYLKGFRGEGVPRMRAVRARAVWERQRGAVGVATLVGFVNVVSNAVPVVLLAAVFDPAEVGLYALVYRTLGTPLGTFTQALSLSFWTRAAELYRDGRMEALTRAWLRVTRVLGLLALAFALAAAAVSTVLEQVLGPDWIGSGSVMLALIPLFVGQIVVGSTNHMVVLRRQELQLVGDGFRLASMLLATLAAQGLGWGFVPTVLVFSLCSSGGHAIVFAMQLAVHLRARRAARFVGQSSCTER